MYKQDLNSTEFQSHITHCVVIYVLTAVIIKKTNFHLSRTLEFHLKIKKKHVNMIIYIININFYSLRSNLATSYVYSIIQGTKFLMITSFQLFMNKFSRYKLLS